MSSYNHFIEEFSVVLYKNNLWLKGKKNFFGENYFGSYIRFTYAENFTFNIFETEICNNVIDSLPHITSSVELIEIESNPSKKNILDVNTFIGHEIENQFHENKMTYPEFIIFKNKHYTNLNRVEMPTELYKNYGLHNEFELIMLNCRLYTIYQFITKKIYYGTNRLKYDFWLDDDKPECSLNLCPMLSKTLNLDEEYDESDDENNNNKNDYNTIIEQINDINLVVVKLNNDVEHLTLELKNFDNNLIISSYINFLLILSLIIFAYFNYF
jgi:hypothetical protein